MSSPRYDAEHFTKRLLTDCMVEATAAYWLRRAEQIEKARPRPEDHTGSATRAELSAQWQRLTGIARACRARAQVSPIDAQAIDPDIENVWGEAA